jgi:peptidoglycan-associated lipoprotein
MHTVFKYTFFKGIHHMKTKFLTASLVVMAFALSSCKCKTTDETSMNGSGQGEGYDAAAAADTAPKGPMGNVVDRVFYAFDRFDLTEESKKTLADQVKWLQDNPSVPVLIAGNCDERGTREYNIGLGARRANSVREHLIAQGINPQRITVTSHGKDNPTVAGSNEEAWAQNRNAITTPQ